MQRIFSLIFKELIGVWRDPKTRISLLAPPLFQLFVFTFAATLEVKNVTIGILNLDNGELGFELVQRFHGVSTFSNILYLESSDQISRFLDEQKGVMVLSLDAQFSRDLNAHNNAAVQLVLDGRKSNAAQIVAGYATTIINGFNDDFAAKAQIRQQNVSLIDRSWFNPNLLYYWYNIPSLVATLSMLTCLIVTSISVARERELGTFDQLLVSPLTPVEILFGKIVPGVIVGSLEGLLLFTVGVFIFKVPFTGSFPLFFLSLLLFITSIGGIGLFISSLCATQQQAMLGTFIVMAPSVMLSGFATPIENMPQSLQFFTYGIPLRYMLVISRGIFLKDIDASIVFQNLWPMALIGLCNLLLAGWLFRRRLE
ncbi:MAG: ABC transporter permease [Chlamydiales bacterium]|nr:ABC transporter permease [Chlamydiales bacterium]